MKLILSILSKANLVKKATSPGPSPVVIIKRCTCNGKCHHK